MKKIALIIGWMLLSCSLSAQTGAIDAMFEKYSEREGFTVVSISGKLLGMFSGNDVKGDAENVIAKLKSIRILSVEDSLLNKNLNFYTELSAKLDLKSYEELMVVKEGKDITRFLARQKGTTITELLVITGGPSGNSLISITGDLDMKSISNISKQIGIDDLQELEKIENKKNDTP